MKHIPISKPEHLMKSYWFSISEDIKLKLAGVEERYFLVEDIESKLGKNYWIFDGLNFLQPEARPITDFGLPDSLEKVDAAMVWSKNQKTYLFAGDQFWRFNDTTGTLDEGYPMSMDRWYGIPTNLDAATSVASGKTYFFKGNYYWLYNNDRVRPERGYPRKASNIWLGCRVA